MEANTSGNQEEKNGPRPINLTGNYRLEHEKSSGLEETFKDFNFSEIACLATRQLDIKLQIVQSEKLLTTLIRTQVGEMKRYLRIGASNDEVSKDAGEGMIQRKVEVILEGNVLKTHTTCEKLIIENVKTLKQVDGTTYLLSENIVEFRDNSHPKRKLKRVYKRLSDPDQELQDEHNKCATENRVPEIEMVDSSSIRAQIQKQQENGQNGQRFF
eukprot:augustus_masked-scaffold_5-processed-gene-4.47-mRNA-1 protein AED:1.00 eAED:1.00 QI:0/-1/0/0/-1/1/1/0/213